MNAVALNPGQPWSAGVKQGVLLGLAILVLVLPPARSPSQPPMQAVGQQSAEGSTSPAGTLRHLDFAGQPASADARRLAQWIVASADNGALPFAILDKRDARVFVFEPGGRLAGATPVLLGYAAGDDSVPGIGQRPITAVRPEERTTPAGRFVARAGRNAVPEDVVWVDYGAAVSMHRVRLTNPAEHRLERLASSRVADRRISYGCINMPPWFFEQVLWPRFGHQRGIVYVMPEVKALEAVFPGTSQIPGIPAA